MTTVEDWYTIWICVVKPWHFAQITLLWPCICCSNPFSLTIQMCNTDKWRLLSSFSPHGQCDFLFPFILFLPTRILWKQLPKKLFGLVLGCQYNSFNTYSKFFSLIWSQTFQWIPWYSPIPLYRRPIPYVSQIQSSPLLTMYVCVCVSALDTKRNTNSVYKWARNKDRKRESTVRYKCSFLRVWMDHYVEFSQLNTQLGILLLEGNNVQSMKTMKADEFALLKLWLETCLGLD